MELAGLARVGLEYEEVGPGEPLLLIHGGVIDAFFPQPAELEIASYYPSSLRLERRRPFALRGLLRSP